MTPEMHLNLGIKLIKKGDLESAVTAFCTAIKLNPKYSPAYNNLGLIFKNTNRLLEAEACFCRAIELSSNDSYAYNNLGLVLMDLGNLQKAEGCFLRAVELNPNNSIIYTNLGTALEENSHLVEAEGAYRRAIELNPNSPEAHYNLGTFLRFIKRFDEAEDQLCRAVELRSDYTEANFSLGNLYLLRGEFANGWGKYEKSRRRRSRYRQLKIPQWLGEDLTGRSILLCWEYGFGDTIQFVRYVQKVEKLTSKIILWVQKPLERLLAAAHPNLTLYAGDCLPQGKYDYVCSLLSLPVIFNTCNETIPQTVPYIPASRTASVTWREALRKIDNDKLYRVGVVWAGNPRHHNDSKRSIPFDVFHKLFGISRVSWVSLQVGLRAEDLIGTPYNIIDFSRDLVDFMETAGLIETLDLVITVDSAVAHLAGTMGKKTWLLLPFDPDWRWQLDREDSSWYPTIRIFRQRKLGDWQEVVERVKRALQKEPI
ncbi:tetratricopeptide repeat protein [Pelosinus sp. UFO1]|uniref:tetratricopeptide repeat protein n=1 Tax=Pelosinus sp. UFO1 TaxID=484770 RepID=UPI0004D1DF8F|nr:tetratricopeptide repeat protein [Pelosinus sp. UFO1]AIF52434.1 Tetratricopeptide repeat-containing protein [Pelosinus sp. UFO1]